jgi:class 3 adenylate cyclase
MCAGMDRPQTAGAFSDTPSAGVATPLGRFGRLADPLAWTTPEKCLFIAGLFLLLMSLYLALGLVFLSRPGLVPYLDVEKVRLFVQVQMATMAAWLVAFLASWVARRRAAEPRWLVPITVLLAVWMLSYGCYFFGFYTNLFSGLTLVSGAAIGWVLFDRRAINAGVLAISVGLVAMTVLEQAGFIPYAPIFAEAPFRAGVLDRSWVLGVGGLTSVMMFFLIGVVYFIVDRWHDREAKLAVTSQQLARANEVIGRYVASQLAEQIRTGNYGSLDQHARRKLTLFFSDIQGFTAIADVVEPEDLSALLNEYLSEMTEIGERFGATIDKFVGDAIMIFFGAPVATSDRDHALRAVRMALEMQVHMVALRSRWEGRGIEQPFHIRIGINTGQASIGNFGSRSRMDYTAIGRQVNLAARLQSQCTPDRVLLSHSTWLLVRDDVACLPRGEIVVKGFRDPVMVYEVDDAAAAAHPA